MSDEKQFLAQIASQPADRTIRLVYADWLEERGDARAELIRLEEEMRRLPIYGDLYWQLKPRRNELRRQFAGAWLERLQYGTDYEPVFHDVPDGWKERWRLIREFTERWHGIPMGDVGGRTSEIAATEKQLGRSLPPSVREWIVYSKELLERENFGILRDNYEVRHLEDLEAVSLMIQGEGDLYYAVKHENLAAVDPPVDTYVLDYEHNRPDRFIHWRLHAAHLTTFVLQHLAVYLWGKGGGFSTEAEPASNLAKQLKNAFPIQSQFDHLRIFETTNIIVMLGSSPYAYDNDVRVAVEVWKNMPRDQIPGFIWEYTRGGGAFHGMFTPEPR